jgi:hypothetical protein
MSRAGKRSLYAAEAIAILLLAGLGAVYPSLFTVAALASLPAVVLAGVSAFRPEYLDPAGVKDPRAGRRRYIHACAVVACVCLVAEVIWLSRG